jgi:hypothetical protein
MGPMTATASGRTCPPSRHARGPPRCLAQRLQLCQTSTCPLARNLPKLAPTPRLPRAQVVNDTRNRTWPGNPGESLGLQAVKCWNDSQSIIVRVIDSCPCRQASRKMYSRCSSVKAACAARVAPSPSACSSRLAPAPPTLRVVRAAQVLAEGAPGVAKGGETRRQEWCCGGGWGSGLLCACRGGHGRATGRAPAHSHWPVAHTCRASQRAPLPRHNAVSCQDRTTSTFPTLPLSGWLIP